MTSPSPSTDPCVCERCEATEGVKTHSSRTAYHWNGEGEDPNRDVNLCAPCAEEHHAYWDERWAEYYAGCL
jgi:hypothetical protein